MKAVDVVRADSGAQPLKLGVRRQPHGQAVVALTRVVHAQLGDGRVQHYVTVVVVAVDVRRAAPVGPCSRSNLLRHGIVTSL